MGFGSEGCSDRSIVQVAIVDRLAVGADPSKSRVDIVDFSCGKGCWNPSLAVEAYSSCMASLWGIGSRVEQEIGCLGC